MKNSCKTHGICPEYEIAVVPGQVHHPGMAGVIPQKAVSLQMNSYAQDNQY
jgi:hypothetical protein